MQVKSALKLLFLFLLLSGVARSQTVQIYVSDSLTGEHLPGVVLTRNNSAIAVTDSAGRAVLHADAIVPVTFHYTGYFAKTLFIGPGDTLQFVKLLSLTPELEGVTITSVRNNTGIDDSPTRVEVLGQEEMNEENGIKPGNVTSLLGDLSCIQLQTQSAVSGEQSVRIQGLDGRYTQLLRDGLPVYDGFTSGFGLLQLPPQDLKQIEVIKGPSSTLYGAGAIGGMINFVSRTPSDSTEYSITGNFTSLLEENVNFWTSSGDRTGRGYTLTASANHGTAIDVSGDGFSDVPQVNAFIIHPRFFFKPRYGTTIIAGFEAAAENRYGGDMLFLQNGEDSLHVFHERNLNQRITGEFIYNREITKDKSRRWAVSYTVNRRDMTADVGSLDGLGQTGYGEYSVVSNKEKTNLVYGVNVYTNLFYGKGDSVALLNYSRNTIGVFGQLTVHPAKGVAIELGLREDQVWTSNKRTDFLLPRIALLWKWNDRAGLRAAAGMGYKSGNPLLLVPDEHYIGAYHYGNYNNVLTERSDGGEIDVYWRRRIGDNMAIYLNQSFFITQVNHPLDCFADTNNFLSYVNYTKAVQTYGADSYVRLSAEELELYVGYTWTHPQRLYDSVNPWVPVTPTHRVSFTALWELEETFRIGLEGSWIGQQYREDGTATPSYVICAMMIAWNRGRFSFVLNGENLLNVLQSKWEPLYTGTVSAPLFTDYWAPVDGRVINFSVRYHWY